MSNHTAHNHPSPRPVPYTVRLAAKARAKREGTNYTTALRTILANGTRTTRDHHEDWVRDIADVTGWPRQATWNQGGARHTHFLIPTTTGAHVEVQLWTDTQKPGQIVACDMPPGPGWDEDTPQYDPQLRMNLTPGPNRAPITPDMLARQVAEYADTVATRRLARGYQFSLARCTDEVRYSGWTA